MADKKITALTAGTPVMSDVFPYVSDPSGSAVTKKSTLASINDLFFGTSGYFTKEIASIANNASDTATPYTNLSGMMIVVYNGAAGFRRTGIFIIEAYGLGSTVIVSDVASVFSVTPADAGKVCVWYNGASGIGIENKTGGTISNISIRIIGRQT